MNGVTGAIVAQWVATGILAVAVYLSWRQNGRSRSEDDRKQAERWGVVETEIKNIKEELNNPSHGLGAIKGSLDEQRTRCASVTSGFEERIRNIEKDKTK